jgi:hypothetical protein
MHYRVRVSTVVCRVYLNPLRQWQMTCNNVFILIYFITLSITQVKPVSGQQVTKWGKIKGIGLGLTCGFKLGRGDGSLRSIKIRSTSSFRAGMGEAKTSAPCRKILWHVKIISRYFEGQIQHFLRQVLLICYQITAVGVRALVDEIRSVPLSISFHRGSPCSNITWEVSNRSVDGRSSKT